SKRY
ncbi:hypothetical protein S40293_11614, partial [Stachybotrys chartarum IBT 40293]